MFASRQASRQARPVLLAMLIGPRCAFDEVLLGSVPGSMQLMGFVAN